LRTEKLQDSGLKRRSSVSKTCEFSQSD